MPGEISCVFNDNVIPTRIEMSRLELAPRYHPSGTVTGLSPQQVVVPPGRRPHIV